MMRELDTPTALGLYRWMRMARRLDEIQTALAQQGEASFHLGGSGHEGTAALAPHLGPQDWLHPHYRDVALLLARGIPVERYLHSLLGTALADAAGRRLPPFVCDRELKVMSIPTLVGNNALQAVGVAAAVRGQQGRPIVLCGIGDGGTQEGEFLEAVAEAAREGLPVLFLVEDNRYALSTPTSGRTFYSRPDGEPPEFWGVPIVHVDGARPPEVWERVGDVIGTIRETRMPRIVVFHCERLVSHSNADDETVYRRAQEREAARRRDPVEFMRRWLTQQGVEEAHIEALHAEVEKELREALAAARRAPPPGHGPARRPLPLKLVHAETPMAVASGPGGLTMLEAIRETLRRRLDDDPRVVLYGQDIEDPKGDVFGVTRGLSTSHPSRVRNAPLSEATIVGTAIGRALAGERPVAFIQFADFLPVAFNQIFSELGSLYWRTNGAWEAPVIVMAVSGAYRKGLGPFHAQSPEGFMVRVPGIDVFMPSNPSDAAGLLNAAFRSGRPCVFFYPKHLLNDRSALADPSVVDRVAPIGRARIVRAGRDLTLVGWGNTVPICEQVATDLETVDIGAEVLDLRTLSPWDRETVLASARRTGRLVVVHEDMRTGGLGAEIIATVAEELGGGVVTARVTTPDTFLPFRYETMMELLPTRRSLLERVARLLDLELEWREPERSEPGIIWIRAIGSSPSDENIRIIDLHVKEGDVVKEGAPFASVEAEKAAFEIASPASGRIEEIRVAPGMEVRVGTPVARLRLDDPAAASAILASDAEPRPILRRRRGSAPAPSRVSRSDAGGAEEPVMIGPIAAALGSRMMTNDEILHRFPEWSSADVVQRTGIERRYWVTEGETVLTLALKACRALFERIPISILDVDAIICSTGTPLSMTPSLACRILEQLSPERGEVSVQAWDVNAACTGYLYALQSAWDLLMQKPDAKVLVVTAETLSPLLDPHDAGTFFLFGDAATATLVRRGSGEGALARLRRPVLSATGEPPETLYVPCPGTGEHVRMAGQPVFRVAVRKMVEMLERACTEAGLTPGDLSLIVPHQANTRIIEAIRQKIGCPPERMFNHIRDYGNTSSNTIPLALGQVLPQQPSGARIGLCAFGGGFTFGAAILERV